MLISMFLMFSGNFLHSKPARFSLLQAQNDWLEIKQEILCRTSMKYIANPQWIAKLCEHCDLSIMILEPNIFYMRSSDSSLMIGRESSDIIMSMGTKILQ